MTRGAAAGELGAEADQAAADVEVTHGGALLDEVHVETGGLADGPADAVDVRHLGSEVVVQELEAVQHALFAESVHDVDRLRRVQAEDAAVAAGLGLPPGLLCSRSRLESVAVCSRPTPTPADLADCGLDGWRLEVLGDCFAEALASD